MNKEAIIRMAREVGIDAESDTLCRYEGLVEPLERFAVLVAKHTLANIDPRSFMSWQEGYAAGAAAEREACADKTGEFARKWWSIHCASNKHLETTRKAHDDFCALQSAIRARSNP